MPVQSLKIISAIFVKDLRVEWRNRETLASMCVFGILVVFLFNFAFEPGREESLRLLPGLLWISFAFAGVLCFNRSFAVERENACLEGMTLAPVDPGLIYLGKMLANLLFLGIAECVIVFAAGLWYNFSFVPPLGWFALITLLCSEGYVAVGTTFGAIAANTHMREVMLPVLQFPVAVPVLIAGIEASTGALKGDPLSSYVGWIKLAAGFAVIFTVLSYLLFEYVVEE
jgi:heme exporter protein B